MRRSNYGPLQWSFAAPPPGTVARSRRWNLVLIAILAFLVLGVFVVAEAPHTGSGASNSANASLKEDRKSTRLNSSHGYISYAVFCLKKKKNTQLVDLLHGQLHFQLLRAAAIIDLSLRC